MSVPLSIAFFTHPTPTDTPAALESLLGAVAEAGIQAQLSADELEKHGLTGPPGDP
ncbi:hypothetical protein BH18CHL2_BH18CHL2_13520 [soil metagenome]